MTPWRDSFLGLKIGTFRGYIFVLCLFSWGILSGCSLEADLAQIGSQLYPGDSLPSLTQGLPKFVANKGLVRASFGAQMGTSVAFSEDGNTLVVGLPFDSFGFSAADTLMQAGSALVYVRSGGTWVLQQKLLPSGTNARKQGDVFGYSVAISGDTIVVGAPQQDYDENGDNMVADSGAVYVFTRSAGVWSQQQKLVATGTNGRVSADLFGMRVAISGDTLAVGVPYHDYDESGANALSNAGAVLVFARAGNVWSPQQTLVGTGTNGRKANDSFGFSIAMSTDTLVVGAPKQAYDAAGGSMVSDSGAAYVFTKSGSTWSLQQKLIASGTNGRMGADNFAYSVAISADTVAVGVPQQAFDATGGSFTPQSGAVYVFTRTASTWSLQQKLVASGTNGRLTGDGFGFSIAISGDTIAAAAPQQDYDAAGVVSVADAGAAYIFTRTAGVWSSQQKLVGSGTNARNTQDSFGYAIAVTGDTVAVGAPSQDYDKDGAQFVEYAGAVFISSRSANVWTQQTKLADDAHILSRSPMGVGYFGMTTALSEDGNTLVVGSPYDSFDANNGNLVIGAGAVYVYVKNGSGWSFQQKLVGVGTNGRTYGDQFGFSVAISGDTLIAGVPGQSYDENGATLMSSSGAAYVFTRSAGVWSLQQKLVASTTNGRNPGDDFGHSVAISGDTIVIGAPNHAFDENGANAVSYAGAAFVFTRSANVWSVQQKLVGGGTNGRVSGDNFGNSLALSGNTVVIGAPYQDYDENGANSVSEAGAAYVFTRSGSVWSLEEKLVAMGTHGRESGDQFGSSVALSGETVVIGAPFQDYDADGNNLIGDAGAAYAFTRTAGVWSFEQKLAGQGNNGRGANDQFGTSTAVFNDTVIVGAPLQETDENGDNPITDAGAAFVFARSSGVWSLEKKLAGSGTNGRMNTDYFGFGIAVCGNTVAIGAPGQDYDGSGADPSTDGGALWVFDLSK